MPGSDPARESPCARIACFRSAAIVLALAMMMMIAGTAPRNADATSDDLPSSWQIASHRAGHGAPFKLFVEREKTPGRPAFKIETIFEVDPSIAAITLMQQMLDETDVPDGQRREILDRKDREAVVYTFIDLPFMLADREIALRIVHSDDPGTGIHRIDWIEANEVLPDRDDGTVRLEASRGYWEFRPDGDRRTHATYLTQTEIGGSIPVSIGDRLLRGQAVDAVERLRGHIEKKRRPHVASGPARAGPIEDD